MNFAGHINLEDWRGQALITVCDYELMDFLEDHFLDLGVETDQMHPPGRVAAYQLLFPVGTSLAAVWRMLEGVGEPEVKRIVAINIGAGCAGPSA